MVGLP